MPFEESSCLSSQNLSFRSSLGKKSRRTSSKVLIHVCLMHPHVINQ
jgi:hypothetical protein